MRYSHVEDGEKLGVWLATQRNNHDKGILDTYREERLEEYFRMWKPERDYGGRPPSDELWEEKINLLLQFKEREGHVHVPQKHREDGELLGMWLSTQRDRQKKGILDSSRERKLNHIGVSWDPSYLLHERWEKMYNLLVQFNEREGHLNVPGKHVENGENLGVWLREQRSYKKKGILEANRERQLRNAGVSWDIQGDRWEEMYTLLVEFNEREGYWNVPVRHKEDGENLGLWFSRQRMYRRKGTLKADRMEKLDSLGIVWDARSKVISK